MANQSWAYLFSRCLTQSANLQKDYKTGTNGKSYAVLPYSKTGDGFVIIVTRDGKGFAEFHCYALCDLTNDDINELVKKYDIIDSEKNKIQGKGGKK